MKDKNSKEGMIAIKCSMFQPVVGSTLYHKKNIFGV